MIEDWEKRLCARAKRAAFKPNCQRFYFLRHGQTEHNRQRVCQGHTDVPLNATGVAQAETAALALAEVMPTAIAASDLMRVRQTAKPIAERLGLEVTINADLRERAFGIFEDRRIEGQLWSFDHPSVESIESFVDRSLSGFEAALTSDDTLVVSHGGLRRVLAGAFDLDMPYWSWHNALPLRFTNETSGWRAEALTKAGVWPLDGPAPSDLDR
ncbi:MAG: histidine phosphatase family protein [Alphaproteobacteria bacterium]|nr:histidine phosphatase family protein [Alphaproteobacteria bacterium]